MKKGEEILEGSEWSNLIWIELHMKKKKEKIFLTEGVAIWRGTVCEFSLTEKDKHS